MSLPRRSLACCVAFAMLWARILGHGIGRELSIPAALLRRLDGQRLDGLDPDDRLREKGLVGLAAREPFAERCVLQGGCRQRRQQLQEQCNSGQSRPSPPRGRREGPETSPRTRDRPGTRRQPARHSREACRHRRSGRGVHRAESTRSSRKAIRSGAERGSRSHRRLFRWWRDRGVGFEAPQLRASNTAIPMSAARITSSVLMPRWLMTLSTTRRNAIGEASERPCSSSEPTSSSTRSPRRFAKAARKGDAAGAPGSFPAPGAEGTDVAAMPVHWRRNCRRESRQGTWSPGRRSSTRRGPIASTSHQSPPSISTRAGGIN